MCALTYIAIGMTDEHLPLANEVEVLDRALFDWEDVLMVAVVVGDADVEAVDGAVSGASEYEMLGG